MVANNKAVAALTPTFLKSGFFSADIVLTEIMPLPRHLDYQNDALDFGN